MALSMTEGEKLLQRARDLWNENNAALRRSDHPLMHERYEQVIALLQTLLYDGHPKLVAEFLKDNSLRTPTRAFRKRLGIPRG